jgi:nitroreductase
MKMDDVYPLIFKRKSIRNYDLSPLNEDILDDIREEMSNLIPLHDNIKTEMKIISSSDVKKRLMKPAPHYIAAFSETKEDYLTNIGFILQQMDLILASNGIGTCWQGIPLPKASVLKSSDLKFIILIAFGKPSEPLYRESTLEFKRKSLHEISRVENADELMEAARLAPSATNNQPWYFTGDENMIHAYSAKPNFIKALVVKKYIPINMGIAIYHLKVAAEHFGNPPEILFDKKLDKNPPKGYEYFVTLKLDK